jgi:uncharacterized protein (DUF305 family)
VKKTALALATVAAVAIGTAAFVFAQDKMDHSKMDHSKMDSSGMDAPATKAFKSAMDKMHTDMMMTYSGNADADFIKGMMPHHQGAIDMAKIELQYGRDPEAKKLAEEIIKAQETEMAFMKGWLAKQKAK